MYKAVAANKRNTAIMILLFILIIGGLGALAGYIYNNQKITIGVVLFASVYAAIQYFLSGRLAMAMSGGRQIQKTDAPELWRIIENLSVTAGIPMPKVYIIDDPAPNAFATGRNPKNAMVAATTGLLNIMDKRELEGVMAHELSHVRNYDILVSMVVFGLVSAIGMLSDLFFRIAVWGSNDRGEYVSPMVFAIPAMILAPIAASIVQLAISRQREYLADASAALLTRDPDGMVAALEKLKSNSQPMQRQHASLSHLYINDTLKPGFLAKLFSTHPPIDDRIARLKSNAERM